MHGLVNRSIESFVRSTYGDDAWRRIVGASGVSEETFEPMMRYPVEFSTALVAAAASELGKPREMFLEDLGHWLVASPYSERVRRLLRLGGIDFEDFLHSLDDLRDRARLAVPDLNLPQLSLHMHEDGHFTVSVTGAVAGFGHVLLGVLRAMADDYGALIFVDHLGNERGTEVIEGTLLDSAFAGGRAFDLARVAL